MEKSKTPTYQIVKIERDWSVALILSIFLGWLGIDRFYLGQGFVGFLKLITFGGLGVWWLIDIFIIGTKSVRSVKWKDESLIKKHPILIIIIFIVAFNFIVLASIIGSDTDESTVIDNSAELTVHDTQTQKTEVQQDQPAKKTKSATLRINRVIETVANLGDIRITVDNTGDVSINPEFDVTVTDESGDVVCEDSPLFSIGKIKAGEKKTDEITILGCMFTEDGDYGVEVDLLDGDYNKLDSASKRLTVDYWDRFDF